MGFTDFAPSLEHVQAFRLHHLQDVHWERVTQLDIGILGAVEDSALHIDAATQILTVALPVPPDFLSMIQLWAKPGGIKEKTMLFHLDVERLHQAFEHGNSPADLRAAWEACAGFRCRKAWINGGVIGGELWACEIVPAANRFDDC